MQASSSKERDGGDNSIHIDKGCKASAQVDKVARKETQSSSKSVDVAALEALSSDKRLVVVTLGICKHLDKPRQPTIKRLEERLARIASNVKGQSSDLDFEPEQQELLLHLVQEYGLSLPLELAARINVKAQATEASNSYHQITKAQARDEHTNIGMVSSSTSGGKGRNNDDLKELNGLCDGVKKLFSKVKGDVIKSSTDLKAWSEGVKALSVEVNVLSNEVKAAGAALDVEQAETSTIASSPRRQSALEHALPSLCQLITWEGRPSLGEGGNVDPSPLFDAVLEEMSKVGEAEAERLREEVKGDDMTSKEGGQRKNGVAGSDAGQRKVEKPEIVDVEMRVATPMDTSPDEYADEPLSPLVVEEAVIDAVAKWDGEGWDIMSSSGQAFEVDKVAEQRAGHIVLKEKANDLGAYVSIVDVIPIRESPKILEGGALVRHGKADGHLWTFAHLPAGPR